MLFNIREKHLILKTDSIWLAALQDVRDLADSLHLDRYETNGVLSISGKPEKLYNLLFKISLKYDIELM